MIKVKGLMVKDLRIGEEENSKKNTCRC